MPSATVETVQRAIVDLRDALTNLSIEFLRGEDFDRAEALTQSARQVKELEARVRHVLGSEPERSVAPGSSRPMAAKSSSDFPRFYLQGEVVVKVGLRRDRKSTYEQRCPRPEYLDVMSAVEEVAGDGDSFDAPQIKDKVRCPDYQVYLVLALLEALGYIDSSRRGIYRPHKVGGPDWADEVWRQIPRDHSLNG